MKTKTIIGMITIILFSLIIFNSTLARNNSLTGTPIFLPHIYKPQLIGTPTFTLTATNTPTNTFIPQSTSTETPTPTVTNTATPTETPTPTNTQVQENTEILDNQSTFVDSIDYLHVLGEIQNNTSHNLELIKITANFFNGSNQLIDIDFTYTKLDNLPIGDKTCFEISLPEPSGWSYYEFEVPTYWTTGEPLPNMTLLNVLGQIEPTFHWYEILGQVRNDHGVKVTYVQPVGTLYNTSGQVIGCGYTFVSSTDLDPGQTSSFKMTFSSRNYDDVTNYRLQVDGNPQ